VFPSFSNAAGQARLDDPHRQAQRDTSSGCVPPREETMIEISRAEHLVTRSARSPGYNCGLPGEQEAPAGHGRQTKVKGDFAVHEDLDETGMARAVPAALEVSHLTKVFGGRTALSDISFTVAAGEVFGFLGPNGAGKTTTVRILGTLISPTAGSATVAGIPVGPDGAAEIRQRIAVMPEAPGLYQRLTVTENLEYFARLYGLPRRQERITEALAAVGLTGRAHELTGRLSKGLRQRAALARSLLNDPAVLFLDEPTSGLDPVAAHEVHGLIAGLRDCGVTIFLTTHRLEEAERLCDRVAIMSTSLRTIGRPADLRRKLFATSLEVTVAAALPKPDRVFAGLPAVQGWRAADAAGGGPAGYVLVVSDIGRAAPTVTRALVAAGADVLSIARSRHTLEDVYLELVGDSEGSPR
jgi:ABC-2 type transport system ATP-binding protein